VHKEKSLSSSKRRVSEEGTHRVVEHFVNIYKCALRKNCREGTKIPLRSKGIESLELE
jgi:hypothetical protein